MKAAIARIHQAATIADAVICFLAGAVGYILMLFLLSLPLLAILGQCRH